jgi:hypothetical protein
MLINGTHLAPEWWGYPFPNPNGFRSAALGA